MREACERYGEECNLPDGFYRELYFRLIRASFPKQQGERKKEMGISYLGDTPVVFSLKYRKDKKSRGLRCLTEPGGACITVAEQIDYSLKQVEEAIGGFGSAAYDDVNRITQIIYPKKAEDTENWLSGMWLGMDSGMKKPVLKIYMNLRHQNRNIRWDRLAALLGTYGNRTFLETYTFLENELYEKAMPIGIGCAIGEQGLMGIRLYYAFQEMDMSLEKRIYDRFFPGKYGTIERIENDVRREYGKVSSDLTVEFIRGKQGYLCQQPLRIKTDLSVCAVTDSRQASVRDFIAGELKLLGMDSGEFTKDLKRLRRCFDALFFQYLSVGTGEEGEHFSVYLEPVEGACVS